MAKQQPQAEEEQATGGKKKMIIIIVAVVLLIAIGGGAAMMFMGGDKTATTETKPKQPAKPKKGDPHYVSMKAFTVNLAPEDPVGFLQVQISVLTYFADVADAVEKNKPLIRNNLTLLFGQQKSEDLRSPAGKKKLQKEVKDTIQKVIDKYGSGGKIDNVFFTTFVMQ